MEGERVESMKKEKKDNKDNKGLTLIELLVALAIVSVVVSLAFGFIIRTIKIYTRGSNDSLVQNDAQLTMAQIESLVVNANMGIGLNPDPAHVSNNELYLYYRDYEETNYDSTNDVENKSVKPYEALHIYVDSSRGLCFNTAECTYGTDVDGKPTMNMSAEVPSKLQVLSKNVSNFTVDLSNLEKKSEMKVTLKFNHKDKNYETTNTIKLRNKVVGMNDKTSNGNYFKVLNDTDQKNQVTGISMDTEPPTNPPLPTGSVPSSSSWTGTSFAVPFKVTYTYSDGTTGPGQTIWTLDDGVTGVSINRMTGMITISADYTGGDFYVNATALSAVNKVNTGDGSGKDAEGHDIINSTNRARGLIKVKSVSNPTLSAFAEDGDPKVMKAKLTFPAHNLESSDLDLIHPQVTTGLELKPEINNRTLGADGSVSYDVFVHRPVNYKRADPFNVVISCVVNGKTLTATGSVKFSSVGSEDIFDGVTINVCDSKGSRDVKENETLTDRLRGDRAVLVMNAQYKDTSGHIKSETLSNGEWRLRTEAGDSSGVTISKTSDGYSVGYYVTDYSKLVTANLVYDYVDEEGNWVENKHFALKFNPVTLTSSANLGSQTMFPITRGGTQKVQFTFGGVLNPTLYVLNRTNSRVRVSVSGFNASVTAATNMSSAETVTFGLKRGSTVLNGVSNSVKFYPGSVNTRTLNGGNLPQSDAKYSMFIPPASDIHRYDSSKTLTEAVPCSLYTADGKQILYHDYSNNSAKNKDKNGKTHQYWVEYEGRTFFYHAASRQWRLNE